MLETFKNAWRIEDLRKKILYTLIMLLIYRIGTSFIPIAGMDVAAIKQTVEGSDILGFLNMITGGSLAGFTIFAVGISPYITSSIVMQLLTFAIPALERMSKEGGEEGREKIKRITRYVGVLHWYGHEFTELYDHDGPAFQDYDDLNVDGRCMHSHVDG